MSFQTVCQRSVEFISSSSAFEDLTFVHLNWRLNPGTRNCQPGALFNHMPGFITERSSRVDMPYLLYSEVCDSGQHFHCDHRRIDLIQVIRRLD